MNEPTNRDILAGIERLGRELHLFRDGTEARFSLMGERFDRIDGRLGHIDGRLGHLDGRMDHLDARLDKVELTQGQHSQALVELSAAAGAQAASLNRIERHIKAETKSRKRRG
jgi:uncharacterized coiled-coil protein SlyX